MEEQSAAPVQSIPQPTVLQQQVLYKRSRGNKGFLILFSLFIVLFVGAAGYMFGYQQANSAKQVSIKKNVTPTVVQDKAVTERTHIAKSLTLIKPDPDLQWTDITTTATSSSLTDIMADKFDQQYTMIPIMQGKFYTATGAATVDLNNYFSSQLNQYGWVLPDAKDPYLNFKTFRLHALTAGGTCGGVAGYIGYKDGMVRMVTVQQAAQTCLPPGQANNKTASTQQVLYTVFVSEPTPVQYFSDFVTHTKK